MKKIISHQTLCNCQVRGRPKPPGQSPGSRMLRQAGEDGQADPRDGTRKRLFSLFPGGELSLDPPDTYVSP